MPRAELDGLRIGQRCEFVGHGGIDWKCDVNADIDPEL
jgi:hypothetical protein